MASVTSDRKAEAVTRDDNPLPSCSACSEGNENRQAPTRLRVDRGRSSPLGIQDCCDGFNFAVFSRHAERIELLIFADAVSADPILTLPLDPICDRTGDIWHVLVDGVRWGQAYGYRAYGPWAPHRGHRFDGTNLLLDPYALAVSACREAALI